MTAPNTRQGNTRLHYPAFSSGVTTDIPPDCPCMWAVRDGCWHLKYVNRQCREHQDAPRAEHELTGWPPMDTYPVEALERNRERARQNAAKHRAAAKAAKAAEDDG